MDVGQGREQERKLRALHHEFSNSTLLTTKVVTSQKVRALKYILLKQMSLRGAVGDAAIWLGDCRSRLGSLAMTAFTRGY